MISSHAATMRRREERRLLLLHHGAGDASARDELVHRFLPLARQLACRAIPTILGELKRYFRDHGWADRPARREYSDQAPGLYQSEVAERVGVSPTHVAHVLRRSIEALHETTRITPSTGSWPQTRASDV
jgi:hypothetical protein